MKKIILPLALVAFLAGGCKKDDDCDINEANIRGDYRVTAITYKPDAASPVEDEFSSWDACEKDNIYTFGASGVVTLTDAGTVCTPNSSDMGSWSLNGRELTFDGEVYAIQSFNCSQLVLVQSGPDAGEFYTVVLKK